MSAESSQPDVEEGTRELENLTKLKVDGVLDEGEYALAKQRVMDGQRRAALEAAGWVFQERPVAQPVQAIGYTDLTQEICASGMLAVDRVLDTMRGGAGADQQAQGCAGLAILAEKDGTRSKILAKDAVGVIVAAMTAHPTDSSVAASGCSALGNLAIGEGESDVRARGLRPVLAAMAAHCTSSAKVGAKGCAALANCAFSTEGEAEVVAAGGAEAIVEAMCAFPLDTKLQEEGADALCNLTGSAAGKAAIAFAGGVAALEAVRSNVTGHPAAQRAQDCLAAINDEGT
uniref:Uncharacterized protein n=1 Tax=Haptolina ericina TaxID=156174 RepID=A0A7S3C1E3_9EUKA|mmetsp:Transcript_73483/g.163212  ORF Transcript_73483/g.163212 Transcript_73483/m.163212 type:complete len:288 (+) Transcript_73483:36-899(+)